jgi:hypothetical protein
MCPTVEFAIIKQQRLEKRERKAKWRQKKPDTVKGERKGELEEESENELKHQDVKEEEKMKWSEEATDDSIMNIDNNVWV